MKSSIVTVQRDPLAGLSRDEFLESLRQRLKGRVKACYCFGSFASDTMHKFSDVDLILIQETAQPFLERAAQFRDLHEIGPRLDLFIYTPEEFATLIKEPVGFWKSVRESLKQIL